MGWGIVFSRHEPLAGVIEEELRYGVGSILNVLVG